MFNSAIRTLSLAEFNVLHTDKKVIIELLEYLGYEVTFNKGEYKVDSIKLVAYDNDGNKIKNVEMVPNKLNANIIVDSYSVELPVKIVTTGKITTGYALSSIVSTVSKVTVYGEQKVFSYILEKEFQSI